MERVRGAGAWAGQAEGLVVWLRPAEAARAGGERAGERAAEILRFRAAVARACQDLQRWSEEQETLEARVLLQAHQEAALHEAWQERACRLIDRDGMTASQAALEAAVHLAGVMQRDPDLAGTALRLLETARWIGLRLSGGWRLPPGSVVAAEELSAPELLDLVHPVLLGGDKEPVVAGRIPLVWGVAGLGPDWDGRRVGIDGEWVTFGLPDPRWWPQAGEVIGGIPACPVNGDPEAVSRMARALGRPPVALIHRLDDLAAVPLFAEHAAALALDLDRLGRSHSLRHPGVRLLLDSAVRTGLPLLAGGKAAYANPEFWFEIGFAAVYGVKPPQGGTYPNAVRRDAQGGL